MTASTPGHACLVLGVGLRAHATSATLRGLWQQARALLPAPVDGFCALAVLEGKEQHPALADWLGPASVPVLALPVGALHHQRGATLARRRPAR